MASVNTVVVKKTSEDGTCTIWSFFLIKAKILLKTVKSGVPHVITERMDTTITRSNQNLCGTNKGGAYAW